MDRVPDYESVGCTFESCHAHQTPEFSRGFLFIVIIVTGIVTAGHTGHTGLSLVYTGLGFFIPKAKNKKTG